jgi:hypothetical protein
MSRALRGHAEVRGAAHQRKKLESQGQGWALLGAPRTQHLCRSITRPAIAHDKPDTGTYRCKLLRMERLKRNRASDVVLQLKTPYPDGTRHIVMSPLEFMQRLSARVPRPRLPLI